MIRSLLATFSHSFSHIIDFLVNIIFKILIIKYDLKIKFPMEIW